MTLTLTATIETEWKKRLLAQFSSSPNILALVEIFSDPIQDTLDVCEFILDNIWDISEDGSGSSGELLDFAGELIGVPRPPAQEHNILTMCNLGDDNDPYNEHGFANDDDATVTTGGYFTSITDGLDALDGSNMSDADYLKMIRQKAESYRSKMTHQNLFTYLIKAGGRCELTEESALEVTLDPMSYNDFTWWMKNYIETKGFKPAGVSVDFLDNTEEKT